jgi:GNAT superfamily N-acetyltransferase
MSHTPTFRCRPAVTDDRDFLRSLYFDTRKGEIAAFGWPEAQAQAFLGMQYDFQSRSYAGLYPDAEHSIVETDAGPVGRVLINRTESEFRVVDIALLSVVRGCGIGRALLEDVIEKAGRAGVPVRLSVLIGNPAVHLYLRLGFVEEGNDGMYLEMVRNPNFSN